MIFIENLRTGGQQIWLNKGKSLLTMLGIIIGIASVIFMMTVGQSVKNFLVAQIEGLGTNVLMVMPNYSAGAMGQVDSVLTNDDVEAIKASPLTQNIEAISGVQAYSGTAEYLPNKKTFQVSAYGGSVDAQEINNMQVQSGRFFSAAEEQSKANVALVYTQDVEDIFGDTNPLGEQIKIDGKKITVIGVLEKTSSLQPSMNTKEIIMPLNTVQKLFFNEKKDIFYISAKVDSKENIIGVQAALNYILNERHPAERGKEPNFQVSSMDSFLSIFNNVLLGIQMFLSLIAAISLLVGGIGIMNIMLMNVKERTKEIGLRKAVGAKSGHILVQFLVESIVLTFLGGVIGIIIGISASALVVLIVRLVMPDWNFTLSISWLGVILSCTVAVLTGLVFGLYPAQKASRLSPIEALRYE